VGWHFHIAAGIRAGRPGGGAQCCISRRPSSLSWLQSVCWGSGIQHTQRLGHSTTQTAWRHSSHQAPACTTLQPIGGQGGAAVGYGGGGLGAEIGGDFLLKRGQQVTILVGGRGGVGPCYYNECVPFDAYSGGGGGGTFVLLGSDLLIVAGGGGGGSYSPGGAGRAFNDCCVGSSLGGSGGGGSGGGGGYGGRGNDRLPYIAGGGVQWERRCRRC
jgi:hypothetical protein